MPDLYLQIEDSDAMLEGSSEYCEESALAILESGEIIGQKMIPWGSNYSFAAAVQTEAGDETLAIYKPASGENPLWDFPDG
ncbi:MAG TPA: hypothetical protein PK819_11705, partial [Thermomicrobiales bacterium]|nr:hypothetical protein [Thermomicrobiales bacterium]